MKKIVTILGARPQFIKAAPVSRYLKQHTHGLNEIIVHTGQHYDHNMSQVFFSELDIPVPNYNLAIGSGSHGQQTGMMLIEIEKVLVDESPDFVLIYGDTNTTLAGALAAAKLQIPIAHVEAGLRSYNKQMPEEINRIVADHTAAVLFAPSQHAVETLKKEAINQQNIFFVGDVMYDACLFYADKKTPRPAGIHAKQYAVATIHRAENTDHLQNMTTIVNSFIELSNTLTLVFPLHPRTKKALQDFGLYRKLEKHVCILPPLSYIEMLSLEKDACLIITDSGGVQKEAYFFKVPCITLRTETEWLELVTLGVNRIVPPTTVENFLAAADSMQHCVIDDTVKPYGDGKAAHKIVELLVHHINL